jgi:Fe(II)/alpha-ketoglutarate-dependent arginine beta-hydroxylase
MTAREGQVGDVGAPVLEDAQGWPGGVPYLRLAPSEQAEVRVLVESFVETCGARGPADLEERLRELLVCAHRMPERLRAALNEFRLGGDGPDSGLVLSGIPVREDAIGPTPTVYDQEVGGSEVTVATALLLLVGSLLGDPFSYFSQQRGRLVLDVYPIAGHEDQQLGSSSSSLLEWHNEDAFHPNRADWIALLCMRNPDRVPTMFASVDGLDISDEDRKTLFEDRFVILPDESHSDTFNAGTTGIDASSRQVEAFQRIQRMNQQPQRTAILSGDPDRPYVRIDPAFMQRELADERAERALENTIEGFDRRMQDVALRSGDLLVIDNKRAVHGRRPFRARYDGTDRWLRRVNLTADLRGSAGRRFGSHGRALV